MYVYSIMGQPNENSRDRSHPHAGNIGRADVAAEVSEGEREAYCGRHAIRAIIGYMNVKE